MKSRVEPEPLFFGTLARDTVEHDLRLGVGPDTDVEVFGFHCEPFDLPAGTAVPAGFETTAVVGEAFPASSDRDGQVLEVVAETEGNLAHVVNSSG